MGTAHNTGLPAAFLTSFVTSPNPWSVTPFAEERKQCASPAGSATRGRYTQCPKIRAGFFFWEKPPSDRHHAMNSR